MKLPGVTDLIPAPYRWLAKLAVLVVIFVAGIGVGCSVQKDRDAEKLKAQATEHLRVVAKKDAALLRSSRALRAAGATFRAIDAQTAANVAAAEARAADAKAQAEAAAKDTAAAEKRAGRVQAQLDALKRRDPDCKKLLEAKACASFR